MVCGCIVFVNVLGRYGVCMCMFVWVVCGLEGVCDGENRENAEGKQSVCVCVCVLSRECVVGMCEKGVEVGGKGLGGVVC